MAYWDEYCVGYNLFINIEGFFDSMVRNIVFLIHLPALGARD